LIAKRGSRSTVSQADLSGLGVDVPHERDVEGGQHLAAADQEGGTAGANGLRPDLGRRVARHLYSPAPSPVL